MSTEYSDLQAFKVATTFGVLDVDGDGIITRSDFELLAERVYGLVAHGAGATHRKAIYDAAISWWEQLSTNLDVNNDGQITKREYVTDFKAGGVTRQEDYFDRGVGPLVTAVIHAADSDNDGSISEQEYVTLFRAASLDEDVSRAAFQQIDRDGDGKITLEEFRTAVAQLFFSEDPEAPGSGMLGEA